MSARSYPVRLSPGWPKWHLIASSAAWLLAILSISSPGAAYLESWTPQQVFGLYDCSGPAWFIDPSTGHDNLPPSLRSGPVQTVGKSRLCRNVTAPASISWWWKAEGDGQRLGQLRFLVDGEVKYVCSSLDWSYAAYTVREEGEHTVSWEYYKIKSYPEYAGAGWIDDLSIESQAPWVPPVIEGANVTLVSSQVSMGPTAISIQAENLTIGPSNITVEPSYVEMSSIKLDSLGINANQINISSNETNLGPLDVRSDVVNVSSAITQMEGAQFDMDRVELFSNMTEIGSLDLRPESANITYPEVGTVKLHATRIDVLTNETNLGSLDVRSDVVNLSTNITQMEGIQLNTDRVEISSNITGISSLGQRPESANITYPEMGTVQLHATKIDVSTNETNFISINLTAHVINVSGDSICQQPPPLKCPSNATVYVDEIEDLDNCTFDSITEALEHVSDFGTIKVYKRSIKDPEDLIINRPVNITGDNTPQINLINPILITTSNVKIEGFNITGNGINISSELASQDISDVYIIRDNIASHKHGVCLIGSNGYKIKNIIIERSNINISQPVSTEDQFGMIIENFENINIISCNITGYNGSPIFPQNTIGIWLIEGDWNEVHIDWNNSKIRYVEYGFCKHNIINFPHCDDPIWDNEKALVQCGESPFYDE